MVHVALTLVLRFADVGIATYGSLRIVGQPEHTVTWVVEEPLLLSALAELDGALPEPTPGESPVDALQRALSVGPFASQATELTLAYRLGVLLLSDAAWRLLVENVVDAESGVVRLAQRPPGPRPVGAARRAAGSAVARRTGPRAGRGDHPGRSYRRSNSLARSGHRRR